MTSNPVLRLLPWAFHLTDDALLLEKRTLVRAPDGTTYEISGLDTTAPEGEYTFSLVEMDASESMWRNYKDTLLDITPPRGIEPTQGLEMGQEEAVSFIMDSKKLRDKLRKHMEWSRVSRKRVQELVKNPAKVKEALDIIVSTAAENTSECDAEHQC